MYKMVNIYHSYSEIVYFVFGKKIIKKRVFSKRDFDKIKKDIIKEPSILGYVLISEKQTENLEVILNTSKSFSLYSKPYKSIICYAYVGNNSYVGICSNSWFSKLTKVFIIK